MRKLVSMLLLAAMLCGCGGSPNKKLMGKEIGPPKPPPPVPPRRNEPLDEALRENARRELRDLLTYSEDAIRANAIEAVQNTIGAEGHDVIADALKDKSPRVRFAAAMAAGQLKLADLHDALWAMRDDKDQRVRIAVRFALHKIGDVRLSHDFEKLAVDPNPRVRTDTAFVLGFIGEKALKILREMINDPDRDVRIQVADSMWRMGDDRGLEFLVAGIISQFPDDQMICLMGLVGPKDQRVQEYVRGKLTDNYTEIGLVAARAMGELGLDDGYTVAMNGVKSADPRQRHLGALALGAIGRSDAQSAIAPLLKDPNPRVRVAAATALLQLKAPS